LGTSSTYQFFYIPSSYSLLLRCRGFYFSLDLHTIGRTPWTSDRSIAKPLPKYRTTPQKNAHTHTHQTSMPEVGFEPTITASEIAKTVHALETRNNVHITMCLETIYELQLKENCAHTSSSSALMSGQGLFGRPACFPTSAYRQPLPRFPPT
jgi:hypothetical protein